MKKSFLLLAVAGLLSFGASAAIPTTFNYQGVCAEKSSNVTLRLEVTDATGECVYIEEHAVTTNANGLFNVVIGEGTPKTTATWEEINWVDDNISVKSFINDVEVSDCKLQAVPYAIVAKTVEGMDYVEQAISDISSELPGIKGVLNAVEITANSAAEQAQAAGTVAYANAETLFDLVPQVEALADGLVTTQGDVSEISKQMPGILAHINEANLVFENLEGLVPVIETLVENVETNTGAIENIEQTLVEITPEIPAMKGAINGLEKTVEQIVAIVGEDGALAALELGFTQLSNKVDSQEQDITKLFEDLMIAQEDISNISGDMPGMKAAINGLEETVEQIVAIVGEDGALAALELGFTQLSNKVDSQEQDITKLFEDLMIAQEDISNISGDMPGMKAAINGLEDTVEQIVAIVGEDGALAALELGFTQLSNKVDSQEQDITKLFEDLMIAQEDISNISADMPGLKAQVNSLTEGYDTLLRLIQNNAEAIGELQKVIR